MLHMVTSCTSISMSPRHPQLSMPLSPEHSTQPCSAMQRAILRAHWGLLPKPSRPSRLPLQAQRAVPLSSRLLGTKPAWVQSRHPHRPCARTSPKLLAHPPSASMQAGCVRAHPALSTGPSSGPPRLPGCKPSVPSAGTALPSMQARALP